MSANPLITALSRTFQRNEICAFYSLPLRGQIDIIPEDIAVIPYVMNNFDRAKPDSTDNKGNKTILFTKRVNGTTYVVGIEKGKDKTFVVTSWTKKKSDVQMQEAPKPNVQDDSDFAKVIKEVENIKKSYNGRFNYQMQFFERMDFWGFQN